MSNYVKGPKELSPILSQIGFVDNKEQALKKQKELKIGQSLVDKRGKYLEVGRFYFRRKSSNKKIIDSQLKMNKLEEEKDL